MKRFALFLFTLAVFLGFAGLSRATFFGDAQTGLRSVVSGKYRYSLYVPKDYSPDRSWPLVIALHDEGGLGEDYIQDWLEGANERGFLVFSPTYPVPRDLPHPTDQWLLERKHEIEQEYAVDPNRILVTGTGFGGHYALYLGLQYPNEFSAVVSVGNALGGRLERFFNLHHSKGDRLPILILNGPEPAVSDTERTTMGLDFIRSRGYSVETVDAQKADELKLSNVGSYIYEWFDRLSKKRTENKGKPVSGLKQSFWGEGKNPVRG